MFKWKNPNPQPHVKDQQADIKKAAGAAVPGADDEAVLHAIDYQDVAITPQGAKIVKQAARSVIDQFMPAVDSSRITVREAMALFLDHVFWDERTGGLLLCTDLSSRAICLPLAKNHWTVRRTAAFVQ